MNALVPCHRHRRFLFLLLFLGFFTAAWGQPKAAFSAQPTAGCSPLVVYFFDSSSGNPTQWKWDLGNGVVSFLRNPSATYFNPGTYTVKLVVSNAKGKDSVVKKELITVYAAPTPDFSFDKSNGCFPLPVSFSDKSLAGSGTAVSWQWDFGDGTISTEQNPAHTYTTAGNFAVTLRVTNSFGCTKTITKKSAIQIASGVSADFSFTDPGFCPAPATVQFTNNSAGPGPLSYQWNFGDGRTGNEANPTHTYTANGKYSVSLIATSPQGCTDTIRKDTIVKIGLAKADFAAPSEVCVHEKIAFANASSVIPASVQWDFGDATTSTQLNPVKTYAQAGTFTVRLISNFGTCTDTVQKTVTVSAKPVADFSLTKGSFCRLPAEVSFSSLATGTGYSYQWDFGDSTTATTSNPSHTYFNEGTYTVKLIVTNASGCSDTLVKKDFIRIQQPALHLTGLSQTGCAPKTINPKASYPTGQTITGYLWDFGDGTTSTAAQPEHTYTSPGTYTVRLVVTTTEGCSDTATIRSAVRVGKKPTANFLSQPLTVCPLDRVFFTDNSTGNTDQWFWNFGDGGTSTLQNPYHQYSDTGWHDVTLVVYNNTCPDTMTVRNAVYINPPIADFYFQNDCDNRFRKQFRDRSVGAQSWAWDFGDGQTSTEQHPTHVYQKTGTYSVRLTVTNGNCSHMAVYTVTVINEIADFTLSDTAICRNGTAQFSLSGINRNNIVAWQWQYGDGASSNDVANDRHTYTTAGVYNVTLTITDLLGCKSTQSQLLRVFGPVAQFNSSAAASCLKDNRITFHDASVPDGEHPIVNWTWNYGDGTIDFSSAPPYQHSYSTAGNYTVKLTVKDDYGCSDSMTLASPMVIAQPLAAFNVSDTVMCTGKNIRLINGSQAIGPAYLWTFGDGNRSALSNPSHAYASTGQYTIKLLVTDIYGCKDSVTKIDAVKITYPKAAFTLSDTIGTCPPLLVHFTNQSSNYTSIAWDFGDANFSKLDTPSHFYSTPGTFSANLVATGPGGCTDTARQTIVVKGPSGTFSYVPLSGCNPLTVHFKANTKNNASFIWDFSDGTTAPSSSDSITHTYIVAGDFVPRMILTDAGGCTVPVQGKDTIRVMGVSTDFDMNTTKFCDDGTVEFTNRTVSNDFITSYQWSFGDGKTSTGMNPSHHYEKPGSYTVQLRVTTQAGCSDARQLTDTVKVYPSPVVNVTGDSAACAPAIFTYRANVVRGDASLLQWAWDMDNGQTAAVQNPAAQKYPKDGSYRITAVATDNNGCRDTSFRNVIVHPLPQTNAGADQWICRGTAYQLKATGAATYQWNATPTLSCTDCEAPLAAPADSTQYVVTGYTPFGCSRSDSVIIRVHQPFTVQVEKGDTICQGKTVNLAAIGAEQYTWVPSAEVKNPAVGTTTATPQVSTLYTVIGRDNAGCFTDTGFVYIKVWPIPVIQTETAKTLSVGNTMTLKPAYSADVTSYQWSNAQTLSCATCPSPEAKPKTETKYTIEVKNDGGCAADETITVRVICNDGNLFIPNTFSPNIDGRNDQFYPRGTGISSIKSLKVYNRWGEMVFSRENFAANDAASGWDGTYKGAVLAPDVYVYTCEVVCMNNEVLLYRGDITLLR